MRKLWILVLLFCGHAFAQSGYGVGFGPGASTGPRTTVYVVSPSTGIASTPTVPNGIPYESSAMAVSPLNGFVYYIERNAVSATPRLGTWNPLTGATFDIGPTGTTVIDILRATFCPDGRLYIGGSGTGGGIGVEIYEINPSNGALLRTLVLSGPPAGGSGDIVCTNSGELYVLTAPANAGPYTFYRASAAQLVTGGTFAPTTVGNLGTVTAPNGLFETPNTLAGCAAAPNPCFLSSGGALGLMYTINSTTGVATTLTTASGAYFTDMSREFPRDLSISKTVTPTAALQSSNVITYTLVVRNPGPAVAGNVTVVDNLPIAGVNTAAANWSCSITATGQTTNAITSACATPTGSGPINTTVNLAIGGTAQFVITVPLFSTFTGTLTNTATAVLPGAAFDSNSSNNIVTVTSPVNPAANLSVTKTDGITTTVAGSTNNYTVTFTNSGPGDGAGSVVKDVPSAGLSSCTVIACTGTGTPAAVCPAPLNNLLTVGGATVATFPANTSLVYTVRCGVTATGQ
jgi:uncharacterized repeat protein (TIGR01451 family)